MTTRRSRLAAAALLGWSLALAPGAASSQETPPAPEGAPDQSAAAPPRPASVSPGARAALERGVDYLLSVQRKNGSWGTGETPRTYEILADIPGSHDAFRAATTALCVMALERSPHRSAECRQAVRRGLDFLVSEAVVRRPNGGEMYNVWAFGYGLRAFAQLLPRIDDAALKERVLQVCARIVKALEIYQTPDGGWGYYDFEAHTYRPSDSSMSFTTATILVSLHAIEKLGVAVPRTLLERAIKSIRKQRMENGAYLYGPYMQYRPGHGVNKIKGSLGRTQACNYALWLYGENVSEDDLRSGVENLFKYHQFLDVARKRPIPHEAWYYNSGYFYYYGLYYCGLVLDLLPEADRAGYRARLEKILLERQEKDDGSWWDYPLYSYHKPYGTAYALLTLLR